MLASLAPREAEEIVARTGHAGAAASSPADQAGAIACPGARRAGGQGGPPYDRRRLHLRRRAGGAGPETVCAGGGVASRRTGARSSPRPPRPSWSTDLEAIEHPGAASSVLPGGSIRLTLKCRWVEFVPPARATTRMSFQTLRDLPGRRRQGHRAVRWRGRATSLPPRIQSARLMRRGGARMWSRRSVASAEGSRARRSETAARAALRRARPAGVHRLGQRRHHLYPHNPLISHRERWAAAKPTLRRAGDRSGSATCTATTAP